MHEIVEIDPTSQVQAEPLRTEIDLLSEVARRARTGDVELLWNVESEIEFFGIHLFGGGAFELLDAGVTIESSSPFNLAQSSRALRAGRVSVGTAT